MSSTKMEGQHSCSVESDNKRNYFFKKKLTYCRTNCVCPHLGHNFLIPNELGFGLESRQ